MTLQLFVHQDWSQIKSTELRLWAIVSLLHRKLWRTKLVNQFAFRWKFADISYELTASRKSFRSSASTFLYPLRLLEDAGQYRGVLKP